MDQSVQHKSVLRTAGVSIAVNLFLAVAKFISGFLGGSFALIADGIESLTDTLTGILLLLGIRYAQRPADENHPYGHGKAEALTTFIVVGFMVVSATSIIYQSVVNFYSEQEVPELWTLYVMGGIILWKELSYRWVKRKSVQTNSTALSADAWHHRSDALTTVAALLGVSMAWIFKGNFVYADEVAAIIAALVIYYSAYTVFRPALGEIMDESMHPELMASIRKLALEVDGIKNTEKLRLRKSGLKYHLDLHARVDGNLSVIQGHDLAHKLQAYLKDNLSELGVVSIHIEPA